MENSLESFTFAPAESPVSWIGFQESGRLSTSTWWTLVSTSFEIDKIWNSRRRKGL